MIPFLDVGGTNEEVGVMLDEAYARVRRSGWFILGKEVEAFEAEFAEYCGVRHAVAVGNGLDALVIALRARGIGVGDEVLVSGHTFIATWLAVAQTGATLVPVDADSDTMNTSEDAFLARATPNTKAIIPVHLYGLPVPLGRLRAHCDERGIFLLEDAAQAHGARAGNRKAGSLGHAAAFSFYPGKNLGALGDGGAIVTDDPALAEKCRTLSNYGSSTKYIHDERGVNSRLDELQAAFLREKLKTLDRWNARREEVASTYLSRLASLRDVTVPHIPDETVSSYHLFVIRLSERNRVQEKLSRLAIGTGIHYPIPNHRSGAFAKSHGECELPVAEAICRDCLSLPIGPHMNSEDAMKVCIELERVLGG